MKVSVRRYTRGENINPIMLRLADLILGNFERRGRRPDYTIFVVARSTPITDGRRWWWEPGETLVRSWRECCLCVLHVVSVEP